MPTADEFFQTYFSKLANVSQPYHWQSDLFHKLVTGEWRNSLTLPTGTGKTGLMQIWVTALAWCWFTRNGSGAPSIPRRLVWVVNRRVVVDQATEEAERIAAAIRELPDGDLLKSALQACSGRDSFLAISTLRGQKADNRAWSKNPACPAIVIGTVDMIGSRLLFRGYGDSRYRRPIHAGLLGVDTLIVNDEAHLSPAFAKLLLAIESLLPAKRFESKGFRVLLLSATSSNAGARPFVQSLEADLASSDHFRRIYTAEKRLHLHSVSNQKELEAELLSLAAASSTGRTILFIEQPEKAFEVQKRLQAATGSTQIALLTGTMRGWERDRLAEYDPVFAAFSRPAAPAEPHWLVTTSAGEVGVNITCERMISALAESDHMLQRFGRLNRFPAPGVEAIGEAHVIYIPPADGSRQAAALEYLLSLAELHGGGRDVSCRSVYEHEPPPNSRSQQPSFAELTPPLVDLWAQTTATGSGIAEVAPWLHGKEETEIPETEVAWREDVRWLAADGVSDEERERALEHYPILTHERLSEPHTRVEKKLAAIAEIEPHARGIIIAADGSVAADSIANIARRTLKYVRVLLPARCGAVSRGMFRPEATEPNDSLYDIADSAEPRRERYRVCCGDDGLWRAHRLGLNGERFEPVEVDVNALFHFTAARSLGRPFVVTIPAGSEEEPSNYLLYCKEATEPKAAGSDVPLSTHLDAVAERAARLACAVDLEPLREVVWAAGKRHDLGKSNPLWQRAMGGSAKAPLAKTKAAAAPGLLAGFRHELDSLMKAADLSTDELVLHLIASHHGWARPYFEPKAFCREDIRGSHLAALRAAQRFGELQAIWGHWGLAYLEALFKAADALASEAHEGEEHD